MIVQLERSEAATKAAEYQKDFFETVEKLQRGWRAMGYGNDGVFKFLTDLALMIHTQQENG